MVTDSTSPSHDLYHKSGHIKQPKSADTDISDRSDEVLHHTKTSSINNSTWSAEQKIPLKGRDLHPLEGKTTVYPEWIDGSFTPAPIASGNVIRPENQEVTEAVTSFAIEKMSGHAGQYRTTQVSRLLENCEYLKAGGWWVREFDSLNNWQRGPEEKFKPVAPRQKFEHPDKNVKDERPTQAGVQAQLRAGPIYSPLFQAKASIPSCDGQKLRVVEQPARPSNQQLGATL